MVSFPINVLLAMYSRHFWREYGPWIYKNAQTHAFRIVVLQKAVIIGYLLINQTYREYNYVPNTITKDFNC